LDTLIIIALALVLFLASNWLGGHTMSFGYSTISFFEVNDNAPAFNFTYRVATPQVFLVLSAAALHYSEVPFDRSMLWQVTALSFLVRWAFNIVRGRAALIVWTRQFAIAIPAIAISKWLSSQILYDAKRFLPDKANLTTELWMVVILFLYSTAGGITLSAERPNHKKAQYIAARYYALKRDYRAAIAEVATTPWTEPLAFSVLLVETFNRPRAYQLLERWVLFPLGLARSLGPMQVKTNRPITDEESVRIGTTHLDKLLQDKLAVISSDRSESEDSDGSPSFWNYYYAVRDVAVAYNPDGSYADEVSELFSDIVSKYYPSLRNVGEESAA
jgi:hypothetical protein